MLSRCHFRFGEEVKRFTKHTEDVMAVAVDYTNRYIASCGRDRALYITYLDDEEDEPEEERHKHSQPQSQRPQNRSIQEMRELDGWTPYKTQRDIRCCDFSPYGDTVACASEDHQVHILALPKECHMRSKRQSMRQSIHEEQHKEEHRDTADTAI